MRPAEDNVAKKEFNEVEWSVGHHPPSVGYYHLYNLGRLLPMLLQRGSYIML